MMSGEEQKISNDLARLDKRLDNLSLGKTVTETTITRQGSIYSIRVQVREASIR